MKKEKVLVTGGAGYLGSVLIEYLLKENYYVTVLDNLMYKQTSLLRYCNESNFNFIKGDVANKELLKGLVKSHDTIIPLAAIVGAPACKANEELAVKINYEQIQTIVDTMTEEQKLIMPNTNSQYGSSKDIITEESPQKPLSLYAITKCDAEQYILDWGKGVCLRLATVFGSSPRMRTDLLVNDFVYKTLTEGVLVLFQSHFKRNYIHVRDIARTFIFCIKNYNKMNGQAYNVGLSHANLNKRELAEAIKTQYPDLVIIENDFSSDFDNRDYIVSNYKLESLGWKPKHFIEEGIKELAKAYQMIITDNNKKYTNL